MKVASGFIAIMKGHSVIEFFRSLRCGIDYEECFTQQLVVLKRRQPPHAMTGNEAELVSSYEGVNVCNSVPQHVEA